MINNTKGIVVHGHRDSIFKENTIQQCTCTVSIILAISIKALARALSFFPSKIITRIPVLF
ncbi:TPA: hypothetical protein ACF4E2_004751, partial [Escherichia coli]